MAVSAVDIINRGLSKLGDLTIRSLDDNTTASRLAIITYDFVRRAELAKMVWNFALKRTSITYLTDSGGDPIVPSWNYGLTYLLPADCLRVIQVSDIFNGVDLAEYRNQDDREYVLETYTDDNGNTVPALLTNMTGNNLAGDVLPVGGTVPTPVPLPLLYVADTTNTAIFHPLFVEALACQLAVEMCERLTQSTTKQQMAQMKYTATMREARFVNAVQNPPQSRPDNTWILSRVS
jgi:hypothetical protein